MQRLNAAQPYLIDTDGRIRKTHFGEGEYDKMEDAIRQLLKESGNSVKLAPSSLKDEAPAYRITPETYLGLERMERFVSNDFFKDAKKITPK
ncbi:MAG TPA: hypothetical protein VMD04_02650 [Candidatus Margulisiibacteriota bacterium]|nr:hypothetical protein [Candidatus Margulisiibacteriota bacterium]